MNVGRRLPSTWAARFSRLPLKGREENALSSLPLVTAHAGPSERSEPDGCEASGDVLLTRAPPS
jgi:hypothetical protein